MHGLVPPVVSVFGSQSGDAVARAVEGALADVPRSRGLVLAVLGRGSSPGLRPHEATVRATVQVVRAHGIALRACMLGRTDVDLSAILAHERVPAVDDREPLVCRWPELDHTVTIPHGWIGRHLVLLAPCVGAVAPRRGPIAAAFASIADVLGVGDAERPGELAARVVAGTFAGVTVLVDAEVAIVRARSGGARARLVPAHRIYIAHRLPAPSSWLLALARGFDGWLPTRTPTADLRFTGPAAATPWSAAAGEPFDGHRESWTVPTARRRGAAMTGPRPR